jgi:hypothetical protein
LSVYLVWVVLGFELRASQSLGWHSTTWATPFLYWVFLR